MARGHALPALLPAMLTGYDARPAGWSAAAWLAFCLDERCVVNFARPKKQQRLTRQLRPQHLCKELRCQEALHCLYIVRKNVQAARDCGLLQRLTEQRT
jgi:hypothetical protein